MNRSWLGALILAAVAAAPQAAQASLPQAAPQVAFAGVVQAISRDSVAIGTPNGTVLVPANEASFEVNGMPFSAPSLTAGSFVTVQVPRSLRPVLVFAGLQQASDTATGSDLALATFDQFLATPAQADAEFLTPAPLLTDREEVALATHPAMLLAAAGLPPGVAPPAVPPLINGFAMLPLAAMPSQAGARVQPMASDEAPLPAQNPLAAGNGGFNTAGLDSSSGDSGELPPAVTYGNADQQAAFPDPYLAPYVESDTPPASNHAYDDPDVSAGLNYGGLSIGFNAAYPYGYPVYTPYPVYPYPIGYPYAYNSLGLNFGGFSIGFYNGGYWHPWAPVAWGGWGPHAWGGSTPWTPGRAAFNPGFGAPYAFHAPIAATPTWTPGAVTSLTPFTHIPPMPHLTGSPRTAGTSTTALRTMGFHVPGTSGLHLPISSALAPAAHSSFSPPPIARYSSSTHEGTVSHYRPSVRYATSTHYSPPALGPNNYRSLRYSAPAVTSYRSLHYTAPAATTYHSTHYNALPPAATYEPSTAYRPAAGPSYRSWDATPNSYRPTNPTDSYSQRRTGQFSPSGATFQPNDRYRPEPPSNTQYRTSHFNEPNQNSYHSNSSQQHVSAPHQSFNPHPRR